MPVPFLRKLSGRERSAAANRQLGLSLAFVAGAANAGGFLAVGQYTSHMTGIVSSMADNVALGGVTLALAGVGALLSFAGGAATSAILINWTRRRRLQSEFALALMVEAALMLCFGLMGSQLSHKVGLFIPATVMLLCFMMGLQNAIVTKLSRAEIRTTHVTGLITDIGIELGKLAYWNRSGPDHAGPRVVADRRRLGILSGLLGMFFAGGVAGAIGFKHVGFLSTVPLALILLVLAAVPVFDDVKALLSHGRR
jgi:uncharacterized membrane protein YoaK (UPF0700 family)